MKYDSSSYFYEQDARIYDLSLFESFYIVTGHSGPISTSLMGVFIILFVLDF